MRLWPKAISTHSETPSYEFYEIVVSHLHREPNCQRYWL